MNPIIYAPPAPPTSVEDCFFYHSMEIPGIGLVRGQWDLRSSVEEYLGRVDFADQRVLEVGPASGFLTFFMENAGAEVVGSELSSGDDWDLVPFADDDLTSYIHTRNALMRALHNGYWLAHQAHRSKAGVIHGSVYDLPPDLGGFDIAVFSAVLLHLRDPFQALRKVLEQTRKTVIISDIFAWHHLPPELHQTFGPRTQAELPRGPGEIELPREFLAVVDALPPQMQFCPRAAQQQPKETWWQFPPSLIREFMGVLGFKVERILYHYQLHDPRYQWTKPTDPAAQCQYHPCFTLVGRRP